MAKKKLEERDLENQQDDSDSNRTGRIGHHQIAILFEQLGFVTGDISVDKGEDVIVQIHERNRFTGLSFYGQFKSAQELTIANGVISQKVKTKQLRRWHAHTIPIFLFSINLGTGTGYWLEINDELIRQIDQKKTDWRLNKDITLHIPAGNRIDEEGAGCIRAIVSQRAAPWIEANKTLELKLKAEFPNTKEGREGHRQMQRLHDAGDSAVIPAKFIKELKTPEWWNRLNGGPIDLPSKALLTLASVPSSEDKTYRMKLLTLTGQVAATRNVVMRVLKSGIKEATLTNDHNPSPFRCQLVFKKEDGGLRYDLNIWAQGTRISAQELNGALPFLKALSNGGTLQLTEIAPKSVTKNRIFSLSLPAGIFSIDHEDIEAQLQKCLFIQSKTGARLIVSDLSFSQEDVNDIDFLMTVLQAGYILRKAENINLTLDPRPSETGENVIVLAEGLLQADASGEPFPISAEAGEVTGVFMGTEISLGPARNHILGKLAAESKTQLQKYIQDAKNVTKIEVGLIEVQMTEEYLDWLPEAFDSKTNQADISSLPPRSINFLVEEPSPP